jgi:ATP-dependent helicase/nuclease subunit B
VAVVAISVAIEPYGDPVFEALADAVRGAKCDDPLAPVTVVVDRGALGLAARRRLAAAPPGVANVRFLTWDRLAAELAVRWLSSVDRRPATAALVHGAVRSALANAPTSPLVAMGEQPATVRALVRTYRELAGCSPGALAALSGRSARAADVVSLVRAARERLAGCYEQADLLRAAAAACAEPTAAVPATVVVYLPGRFGPAEHELLTALGTAAAVHLVVGATGDPAADSTTVDVVARLLAPEGSGVPAFRAAVPYGTRVRAAPSADAEVLMALRHLLARHREGTPLERMALLHGGRPPYPRLAHDLAARAGIPVHGAGVRPLSATVPGRVLLGALSLPDNDWRRDDVTTWCASGPLLWDGRPIPSATWDVVSCEAGVVAGLDQWRRRLGAHRERLTARAAALAGGAGAAAAHGAAPGTEAALRRDAACCEDLWRFVAATSARLAEVPHTWEGWRRWGSDLLSDLLGGAVSRAQWPATEILASDAVTELLAGLAALDGLGGRPPTLADFRMAVAAELDVVAPDTARFGRGLLVGRVGEAVGLDLDVICVVGMVDGAFPARFADDVLVPDRERELSDRSIPLRSPGTAEWRREYLAALAGAPERVLSFPMADQRQGRDLRPSRLLLDTLGHLTGSVRTLYPRDLAAVRASRVASDVFEVVGSYALAVAGDGEPVSDADWALRSLSRCERAQGSIDGHFLTVHDRVLAGALAVRRGRRSRGFTRFDGGVADAGVPSPGAGEVQSPTGLEDFARCPRRYLFDTVLGVTVRVRPETVLQISPLDRGTLVHRVLERLIGEEIAGRSCAPGPAGAPGNAGEGTWDREARLESIAAEELAEAERKGLTGRPALWWVDRGAILGDLRQFARDDARYRAETGAVPVAVEEHFGFGGEPSVEVGLDGGRSVRFRGRIDRVDALPRGGLGVIDYKAGRIVDDGLDEDPVARGTRLQLAVYGLSARRRHGGPGAVQAGYWFVGKRARPAGVTVGPEVEDRLRDVLRSIVRSIEEGRFPANPGSADDERGSGSNCARCPFDQMCPPDRVAAWRRKRSDPTLAEYVALAEPS